MKEIMCFSLVGALCFGVDYGLFILVQSVVPDGFARALAIAGAVVASWWLNRRFTFLSRDTDWARELARFSLSRVLGALVNYGVWLLAMWIYPAVGNLVAIALGTGMAMGVNFITSKYWAYRPAA